MNKNILDRANEIKHSLDAIEDLWHITHFPYPKMFCEKKKLKKNWDKHTGFCYDGDVVSFIHLDEATRDQLKEAINDVLSRRMEELREEFKKL